MSDSNQKNETIFPLPRRFGANSDSQIHDGAKSGHLFDAACLRLFGPEVTDAALDYLPNMPLLRGLRLEETSITDQGLSNLKHAPQLETLDINHSNFNGLQFDFSAVPNLKTLLLIFPGDVLDLSLLAPLTNLETLKIYTEQIVNPRQFPALKKLRHLEMYLDDDEGDDVSLIPFGELDSLQTARVEDCHGIPDIQGKLPAKTLFVSDTVTVYRIQGDPNYQCVAAMNPLPFPMNVNRRDMDERFWQHDFGFTINELSKPLGDFIPFGPFALLSDDLADDIERSHRTPDGDYLGGVVRGRTFPEGLKMLFPDIVEDCLFNPPNHVKPNQPLDHYNFDAKKIKLSIFRIPQTAAWEILTVEGLQASENEFKSLVDLYNLKGLVFEKLWEGPIEGLTS